MNDDRLRILDSDTLSLIQRNREEVVRRFLAVPVTQRAVTVVTVEEQLRGRLAEIRRAQEGTSTFITAYARLQETFETFRHLNVLPLDDVAAEQLAILRAKKIRIGTQDLRIAAIVFSVGGILVTCNTVHFSKILGLEWEDWSRV